MLNPVNFPLLGKTHYARLITAGSLVNGLLINPSRPHNLQAPISRLQQIDPGLSIATNSGRPVDSVDVDYAAEVAISASACPTGIFPLPKTGQSLSPEAPRNFASWFCPAFTPNDCLTEIFMFQNHHVYSLSTNNTGSASREHWRQQLTPLAPFLQINSAEHLGSSGDQQLEIDKLFGFLASTAPSEIATQNILQNFIKSQPMPPIRRLFSKTLEGIARLETAIAGALAGQFHNLIYHHSLKIIGGELETLGSLQSLPTFGYDLNIGKEKCLVILNPASDGLDPEKIKFFVNPHEIKTSSAATFSESSALQKARAIMRILPEKAVDFTEVVRLLNIIRLTLSPSNQVALTREEILEEIMKVPFTYSLPAAAADFQLILDQENGGGVTALNFMVHELWPLMASLVRRIDHLKKMISRGEEAIRN